MRNLTLCLAALATLALSGCIEPAPNSSDGDVENNNNTDVTVNNGDIENNGMVENNRMESDCDCNDVECFENNEECGHTLFVTFQGYTADFGSTAGADQTCQNEAEAFGPWDPGITWRAVLSGSAEPASDRIDDSRVTYASNGTLLAEAGELFSSPLGGSPVFMANGFELEPSYGYFVWTGSNASGEDEGDHCGNWTNTSDPAPPILGDSRSPREWLAASDVPAPPLCAQEFQLYCISQRTR